MKFKNLLRGVLVEEVKNKKLFDSLMSKWRTQNPQLTPEEGENIYNEFTRIREGLLPNRPQVYSFLVRHDGNHGSQYFDPQNLKDITKYTYKQIISLLDEYRDDDHVDPTDSVFSSKDTKPTPERIEASRELWFNPETAIINEDGFRVYKMENQAMSVKFGYYSETINSAQKKAGLEGNSPWCVTWRPDHNGTNQWGYYRGNGRSFYFVIDESKDPETDKYYVGALQRDTTDASGYKLTSVRNDIDQSMSWNDVVRIYPKLAPHKDLIAPVKYTADELTQKSKVAQITEAPNSQFQFCRVSRKLKKEFINGEGVLKDPLSWKSMDQGLRDLYIVLTNSQNFMDRFATYEFFYEIKKVGSDITALNNRLKAVGVNNGVSAMVDGYMSKEFKLRRDSLDNKMIKIYESKTTSLCGIFNAAKFDWVRMDGIMYEPMFKETDSDVYWDEEGTAYFVEVYFKQDGGHYFYCIYPVDNDDADGHFLSQKAWEELKPKLKSEDESDSGMASITDFKPDTDVDIKESKKKV